MHARYFPSVPQAAHAWYKALVAALLLGVAFPSAAAAPVHGSLGVDYFTDTPLTTDDGRQARFFSDLIAGKVVVINFFFAGCGASCPLETARLKRVQQMLGDRMGRDVFFYSVSVDPANDTPAVLAAYKKKYHIGPGWTFLTGTTSAVELLQKKLGVALDESEKKDLNNHGLTLIIGNQMTGQWLRRSHLENAQILVDVIEQLNQSQPTSSGLKKYADAPTRLTNQSAGEQLFRSRCADCHTIGRGDGIGPDLANVVKTRPTGWLRRWLREPDQMLADKDPVAVELFARFNNIAMPNLRLSEVDIAALIAFLSASVVK